MQTVDGGRFCEACQHKVHDLTRMTAPRAYAHALVFGGERLCARMRTDEEGRGVFRAALDGGAARRRATLPIVTVAASLGTGCGAPAADVAAPQACTPTATIVDLAPAAVPTGTARPAIEHPIATTDQDGDGIVDAEDLCLTEAGTADEKGCPGPKKVIVVTSGDVQVLMHPRFAVGRSTIDPADRAILDQVVNVLAHNPQITHVVVEGHADAHERNPDALSLARANAVVAYLVGKGASPSALQPVGAGASKPLAPGPSPAAREQNRRVELRVAP
jgi:outer membrane protein OmpA-like peptidoglycan-associated protein